MMTTKAEDIKVFDVAKPGKVAPSPTARPVIVGHRTMVQDPMVNAEKPAEANPGTDKEAETTSPTRSSKVIKPLESETQSDQPAAAAEQIKEPKTAETVAEETPSPAPADSSDNAIVDEIAGQAAKKKTDAQKDEKEKAKQEAVEKLIAEKKYFVPIGQSAKKSHNNFLVLVVVLIVALIAGYLLVDAGMIDIGVKLPVEFIKD